MKQQEINPALEFEAGEELDTRHVYSQEENPFAEAYAAADEFVEDYLPPVARAIDAYASFIFNNYYLGGTTDCAKCLTIRTTAAVFFPTSLFWLLLWWAV